MTYLNQIRMHWYWFDYGYLSGDIDSYLNGDVDCYLSGDIDSYLVVILIVI